MDDVLRMSDAVARFGLGKVRNNVDRGLWQKPCRGVVLLHNGPITPDQHLAVALASAAPGAALGGLTALGLDGFDGFEAERPQIVLPSGARRPSLPGLEVRWSTRLDDRDVHPQHDPRRTRTARSLVDAASWTSNERRARAIVIAGVQQGLTTTRHLREALSRRGPCRHRALIVESILDAAGGVQSLPERDFGEICQFAGLPRPSRQRVVRGPTGRHYLDASWDGLGMSAEVHGIPHHAVERWSADLVRANEIVIGGDRLLIFSSYATRREQRTVADQLVRMARALGWDGPRTDLSALTPSEQRKRRKFRPRAG
ncbi:hypothetical protein [Aeromicrobium wangtongii]|uniref:Uncharacterized protein n=1 Tax=Aeromicrobium wangtongii TaxID=2969247 RepID=A0ABY5M9G4_9ACTN|nr:hypothetical protein [Aeromicrobium wangtongii]MCD9197273.1 hypothetical protein [Aeromicrobium wangtongii]UUP14768.1 hypothetical protein NQV15_05510 [Aeromicrobium wangtongii]